MGKSVSVSPLVCRRCGGHYPACADGCLALVDAKGHKRPWYSYKALNPELLDICIRLLHEAGIDFEIVTLFDKMDEPYYRIYPKTDATTYHEVLEEYKAAGAATKEEGEKESVNHSYSLREQMATVIDIILCIKEDEANGKTEYTSDEIVDFLCLFIKGKTRDTRKEDANES